MATLFIGEALAICQHRLLEVASREALAAKASGRPSAATVGRTSEIIELGCRNRRIKGGVSVVGEATARLDSRRRLP